MNKSNKYEGRIKEQIFNLLSTPLTATDIKEKLPHIKSMGTIAYHLNKLEEKGVIVRDKQEHVRGQPTYFYWTMLKNENVNNWYDLERIQLKKTEEMQIKILKELKERGVCNPFEIDEYLSEKKDFDEDVVFGFLFGLNNEYVKMSIQLTDKGEEAIRLNKIKQEKSREPPKLGHGIA